MTTPWYEKALDAIGFDILLIGVLVVLAAFIGRQLLQGVGFTSAVALSWKEFRDFFGLDTEAQAAGRSSVLATLKAAGSGAAVLLLAAGAGMTLDAVAHRLLDVRVSMPDFFEHTQANELRQPDFPSCESFATFLESIKFAFPDDEIKRRAFHTVTKNWTASWRIEPRSTASPDVLSKDANCSDEQKHFANFSSQQKTDYIEAVKKAQSFRLSEEDRAKEVYQDAHLLILRSNEEGVKRELARDELFLNLFRVMTLLMLLLFITAIAGLRRKTRNQNERASRKRQFGSALVCFLLSLCFLYLWSQQGRHYYKRVFHAYEIIRPEGIAAFFPPASYFSNPKDATALLKAIVKLQEAANNDSDLKAALKSEQRLSEYRFYDCLLSGCSDDQQALKISSTQRQAWLRNWRVSLSTAEAFDGRTTALLAMAEKYRTEMPQPSSKTKAVTAEPAGPVH